MYLWCMCVKKREREIKRVSHRPTYNNCLFSSHQMCSSRDEIILEGNPLIVDQCKPQAPPADVVETSQR